MRARRSGLLLVTLAATWLAGSRASAATTTATPAATVTAADSDPIDDPKLARRLKSRTTLPPTAQPSLTATSAPAVAAPAAPVAAPSLAAAPAPAPAPASAGTPPPFAGDVGLAAVAPAAGETRPPPGDGLKTPTIGIGYRRFSFVQLGATQTGSTGGTAGEPFNVLSLDFYPISRLVRFGLSTQYGWQSGQLASGSGDYLIAESLSLGIQHAGTVVAPFADAFAGGGYMRRYQFDHTVPTAYWHFGVDAGASFFLGEHGYVSVALGYLRPINGFVKETSFTSVYVDTWSLKLGIGL